VEVELDRCAERSKSQDRFTARVWKKKIQNKNIQKAGSDYSFRLFYYSFSAAVYFLIQNKKTGSYLMLSGFIFSCSAAVLPLSAQRSIF